MAQTLQRKKGALKGLGKVYFGDAAHLLHNAVPGRGWIKRARTVELKTNSGRNRLNVLGAYSPDDHTLISIDGTESCDAEMVCRLLHKLRAANPGQVVLLVLDNVRYQRTRRVRALARRLRIRLLFLPPYSPNLNLIERFWKFLRKKIMRPLWAFICNHRGQRVHPLPVFQRIGIVCSCAGFVAWLIRHVCLLRICAIWIL